MFQFPISIIGGRKKRKKHRTMIRKSRRLSTRTPIASGGHVNNGLERLNRKTVAVSRKPLTSSNRTENKNNIKANKTENQATNQGNQHEINRFALLGAFNSIFLLCYSLLSPFNAFFFFL